MMTSTMAILTTPIPLTSTPTHSFTLADVATVEPVLLPVHHTPPRTAFPAGEQAWVGSMPFPIACPFLHTLVGNSLAGRTTPPGGTSPPANASPVAREIIAKADPTLRPPHGDASPMPPLGCKCMRARTVGRAIRLLRLEPLS